jgi:hypothetical protein
MGKSVVSVGYHFTLSQEQMAYITRLAKEATGKEDEYDAPLTDTYAGVWYSPHCYHGPRDVCKSQSDLRAWYVKRQSLGPIAAYLRQIFVHKKLIIGVIDCMNERFYALLVNNSAGCATTQLKKSCGSGQFGRPIDIERQQLNALPYLHEE